MIHRIGKTHPALLSSHLLNPVDHVVLTQFGINVRQTSVCRRSFDKLKLVGHQTAPLPTMSLASVVYGSFVRIFGS
jgi:hypothetical protein